jgi:hypothetical protein
MTEHVKECRHPDGHEWRVTFKSSDNLYGACTRCPALLPIAEAERRFNATERLSAKEAKEIAFYLPVTIWKQTKKRLRAYADILEGK